VTRTTFAFDWQAAQIEYAALVEAAGGETGEIGEEDTDPAGRSRIDGAAPRSQSGGQRLQ
jgi:hypothetical protein